MVYNALLTPSFSSSLAHSIQHLPALPNICFLQFTFATTTLSHLSRYNHAAHLRPPPRYHNPQRLCRRHPRLHPLPLLQHLARLQKHPRKLLLRSPPSSFSAFSLSNKLQISATSANLQYLDISGNGLESLDALGTCIHLREIKADNNALTSISGVFQLAGLLSLRCRRNRLRSVDVSQTDLCARPPSPTRGLC